MDPRKPAQFWKIVNKVRKDNSKCVVQPIKRGDGSLAVTDEDIFVEMKERYGKESLDVKELNSQWYEEVEEEADIRRAIEEDRISHPAFREDCGHENYDLHVEEVEAAIEGLNNNSAPSPEEQIFNLMLKKGGEVMASGLLYLFQKCWVKGVLPEAFRLDPKIMLPKPGKKDHNVARSYRPITLESVIGKVMERIVCSRLVWKLEIDKGVADTQYAYRKQKSCVQTMIRVCNSISEARNRKENTVVSVMDYESCYERIWRAGLLKKAYDKGIDGRMWVYIKNFLIDRKYYIKVNDYRSPTFTSAVGIPQGSVISPVLCNLYTSDAMISIKGKHAEFADDATVLNSDKSITQACEMANEDLKEVKKWCEKWNMSIAADKTEVLIIMWDGKKPEMPLKVYFGGVLLKIVNTKKILGITLDKNMTFKDHIQERTKAGFGALRSLDSFVQGQRGCKQSVFMRLYKSLVLPVLEYGAPVWVSALKESCDEFGKVQRSAMLKATGCINSTSTDALEVLTNTTPIDLQLKLRQAQEVVRICSKHEDDPLKKEFDEWIIGERAVGKHPTIFQLLISRFREMKGNIELENIEKEFKYCKELMGLTKYTAKVATEEFKTSKEIQEENVRDMLDKTDSNEILIFTDGSALCNPGPTGAGAVIFLGGYHSTPILLKKSVSPMSNNFTGELVGIQLALEFLSELDHSDIKDRTVHFFTDCQPAIITAFDTKTPTTKIDIVTKIKECIAQLNTTGNTLNVHWVPGHKDIRGNELADKQAKEAAAEAVGAELPIVMDKREAVSEMKKQVNVKWQRKYDLSEKVDRVQEIFTEVGKRNCFGEGDRQNFAVVNQLLTDHTKLNNHRAKIDRTVSKNCNMCKVPEDTEHYLFHCDAYIEERDIMEKEAEEILNREGLNTITDINLKVLNGNIHDISKQGQNDLISALINYIRGTKRFFP
ncbi:MAG: reverse transcriptase domain-containing protein [Candidatus Thiodiazotropha endolucinida]|nr:reverse transcriptase domain-containing protein [Candidatus Thiodiazotropha endolucinida]